MFQGCSCGEDDSGAATTTTGTTSGTGGGGGSGGERCSGLTCTNGLCVQ
ncbi:MAG: hypothetical protein IT372_17715 [Polyangiaceae bacterium]|nr:hypothetical protein [Polyangiaceae bacterium]